MRLLLSFMLFALIIGMIILENWCLTYHNKETVFVLMCILFTILFAICYWVTG